MFWGLLRKKSFVEIFNEIWPLARNQSSEFRRSLCGNKIFNEKSQLKMRSNTSLLGRVFMGIASEMLEILTKILRIIFN